ncbi:hypothetical protein HQ571_05080 [Candidatus Kuenenbacteria bacterium]|nr:hypothetical protein [Candidatus Kuenenbacteria bacterium]
MGLSDKALEQVRRVEASGQFKDDFHKFSDTVSAILGPTLFREVWNTTDLSLIQLFKNADEDDFNYATITTSFYFLSDLTKIDERLSDLTFNQLKVLAGQVPPRVLNGIIVGTMETMAKYVPLLNENHWLFTNWVDFLLNLCFQNGNLITSLTDRRDNAFRDRAGKALKSYYKNSQDLGKVWTIIHCIQEGYTHRKEEKAHNEKEAANSGTEIDTFSPNWSPLSVFGSEIILKNLSFLFFGRLPGEHLMELVSQAKKQKMFLA